MSEITRESYIESELKKWEEFYEIGFEKEFLIKAMFELQHQYQNTPDEHVKAKADLLKTITYTLRDLNLKPRLKPSTYNVDILIKTDNKNQHREIADLLNILIKKEDLVKFVNSPISSVFETKDYKIRAINKNSAMSRGLKADHVFTLTTEEE